MLTNEMKSHVAIVALKDDPKNLQIAYFLKVTISFVYKILKKLED